jgi:SAM-dependent methyltransferase
VSRSLTDPVVSALKAYGPSLPLGELVERVNLIYHKFEAADYDRRHPELTRQLPPIWQEMVSLAGGLLPETGLRVLDFGCGTGFEADLLLQFLPPSSVEALTCFDPSPEMLDASKKRLRKAACPIEFVSVPPWQNGRSSEPYDLLISNSVFHHLSEPLEHLQALATVLTPRAVWIAGHEPSRRYFQNHECMDAFAMYMRSYRWRKYLKFRNYAAAVGRMRGIDPLVRTAREATTEGLFSKPPAAWLVGRLIDFHVAHTPKEAATGRGFEIGELESALSASWSFEYLRTYAFMGPFYEGDLPERWRRIAKDLSQRYPLDGANFCSIWRRRGKAHTSGS